MAKVPNIVHFVFGLREQLEPFHLLHYLAIESARRVLRPERILLHYLNLPYGLWWDLIRPHLELRRVQGSEAVAATDYDEAIVPERYRYAHHADFVRLEALLEHGGLYADIDTLFLRPLPAELYEKSFVIGRETDVLDPADGVSKPSLCNALLLAEPGAPFAREWLRRMPAALDGSWSRHSCFLPQVLAEELAATKPGVIHIEPVSSFHGLPMTRAGFRSFFEEDGWDDRQSYSVHLWEHLWWEEGRRDFSDFHAGLITRTALREGASTLARLARPLLPEMDLDDLGELAAEAAGRDRTPATNPALARS